MDAIFLLYLVVLFGSKGTTKTGGKPCPFKKRENHC
jgi:hypothetical protein